MHPFDLRLFNPLPDRFVNETRGACTASVFVPAMSRPLLPLVFILLDAKNLLYLGFGRLRRT
jgi:hypothetical protein